MNSVRESIIECTIGLVVVDSCAAVLRDCPDVVDIFPVLAHTWRVVRDSLNLAGVEDCINAINETITG